MYCVGNIYLAELTVYPAWTLIVVLHDWSGNTASATYNNFVVGGSDTNYKLSSLGTFSGSAGKPQTHSCAYTINK